MTNYLENLKKKKKLYQSLDSNIILKLREESIFFSRTLNKTKLL